MEKLETLVKAIEEVTGRRPHLSSAIRWATVGCKGIYLETCMMGGRRMTKSSWVREFFDATTAATTPARNRATPASHPAMVKAREDLAKLCNKKAR